MTNRIETIAEPLIPVSDRELAIRNLTTVGSYVAIFAAANAVPSFENETYQLLFSLATNQALSLLNVPEIVKRQKAIQQMAREEAPSLEEATGIQWDAVCRTLGLMRDCFYRGVLYFNSPLHHLAIRNIHTHAEKFEKLGTLLDPFAEAPNVCVVAKRCFRRCREAYRTFRTSPGKALARATVSLFNLGAESLYMFVKVKNAYELIFPRAIVRAPSVYTQEIITEVEGGPTDVKKVVREFNPEEEILSEEQILKTTQNRLTQLFVEENARPVPAGFDLQAMENNRTGLSLGLSLGEVRPEIHEPQPLNQLRMR